MPLRPRCRRRARRALQDAAALVTLLAALAAADVVATDYHVSPGGDDARSGTSPAEAWRTLAPVGALDLEPGDSVLLEGGEVHAGSLVFGPEDGGTEAEPVTIASYGAGRATLQVAAGDGILVDECGGIVIRELVIEGPGRTDTAGRDGVGLRADSDDGTKHEHVVIERVDVSGSGGTASTSDPSTSRIRAFGTCASSTATSTTTA